MDTESRSKEKQEILKRYFDAERKLKLSEEENEALRAKIENLERELEAKEEKIQTLVSYMNNL